MNYWIKGAVRNASRAFRNHERRDNASMGGVFWHNELRKLIGTLGNPPVRMRIPPLGKQAEKVSGQNERNRATKTASRLLEERGSEFIKTKKGNNGYRRQ